MGSNNSFVRVCTAERFTGNYSRLKDSGAVAHLKCVVKSKSRVKGGSG